MKWESQKLILLLLASAAFAFIMFMLGIAVGTTHSLKEFSDTIVPLLSMIGTWIASFATVGAVWVALWLAESERRNDTENIKLQCFFASIPGHSDNLLVIKATSDGKRPIRLNSIVFRSPFAEPSFVILQFSSMGNSLPSSLSYGDDATFILEAQCIEGIIKFIKHQCSESANGLKVIVSSTIKSYELELKSDLQVLLESKAKHVQ